MKNIYRKLCVGFLGCSSLLVYANNPVDKRYVDEQISKAVAMLELQIGSNKIYTYPGNYTIEVNSTATGTYISGNYVGGAGILINGNVISTSITPTAHFVGEFYQGGVIFWLDPTAATPGTTGLASSVIDNATGLDWSASGAICTAYNGGGFNDWRLPTIVELQTLFGAQLSVSTTSLAHGGTGFSEAAPDYWASNVPTADTTKAWSFYFNMGIQNTIPKSTTTPTSVRCVRAYS